MNTAKTRRKQRAQGNAKRANQIRHAIKRAHERYGLNLEPKDLAELVRRIRQNEAVLVRRTSVRAAVYDAEISCHTVRVVYDRNRRSIVTFLERDDEGGKNEKSEMVS